MSIFYFVIKFLQRIKFFVLIYKEVVLVALFDLI